LTTIAELLGLNGYSTVSYNGDGYVGLNFGFGKGFNVYSSKERNLFGNIEASKQWIGDNKEKPFFLFLHGYDIHRPYIQYKRYNIFKNYSGSFNISDFCGPSRLMPSNPDDLDYVISQYDGGIRYVDELMGSFFDFLQSEGLLNDTVVILTSDHGDELMEHGECDHVHSVYDEVIRVPLIVRIPGVNGTRVSKNVPASTGILPMILDILGLDDPGFEDNNPLRLLKDKSSEIGPVFSMTGILSVDNTIHLKRSVRTERWKLIETNIDGDITYELFDLVNDPFEKDNLSGFHPEVVKNLTSYLNEIGDDVTPKRDYLDQKTVDQLRNLGYIQ